MSFTAWSRLPVTPPRVTAPDVLTWNCANWLPTSKVLAPASEVQSEIFALLAVGTPSSNSYWYG